MPTIYSYYYSLLKNLNIPYYDKASHEIIHSNYEFYNKYAILNGNKQSGGGLNKPFKYKYKDYTFIIHQEDEEHSISFSIYNNDNKTKNETCMIAFVPKAENYVYLESISSYDNCSVLEVHEHFIECLASQGSLHSQFVLANKASRLANNCFSCLLLEASLQFFKDIQSTYNLKYIQLRDTSKFSCPTDGKKTSIANLYMLTRGETWYGKYGFIPFDPETKQIDIDTLVDYKTNQRLVKLVKVKYTNLRQYIEIASNITKLEKYKKNIPALFNVSDNMSIQDFFKIFIKDYDKQCSIFNEIHKKLMDEIGIVDLSNKVYYKPL